MAISTDNPAKSFLASAAAAADNKSVEQSDSFWTHEEIDAARWNQVFPYQFILVKRDSSGHYIQDAVSRAWSFTLPFPPESLAISTPFAIVGSVTQGGYLEEHGGAPIKMLQLSGTTGVLPLRPAAEQRREQNLAQAIFAGTIQQANRVATSARSFASDVTGTPNSNFAPNLVDEEVFSAPSADNTGMVRSSGYYQFRLLQQFFENYVSFKQKAAGRDYRLALCIFKQQAIYLVTPVSYVAQQAAGSPYEYTYNLTLRAWRRISLNDLKAVASNVYQPTALNPNALQQGMNALLAARDVLENARDVITAVGGDIDRTLFQPLRQVSMFLKDALAVPLSFADLPVNVLNDCQDAVLQYISTQQAFQGASETFKSQAQRVADAYKSLAVLAVETSKVNTGQGFIAPPAGHTPMVSAAADVFRHPEDYYSLLSQLQPGQVNLPPTTIRAIVNERRKIRTLKRLDFEQMRDQVQATQEAFEDAVGASHPTYNRTFQRATRATTKTPSLADFKILFALNRVVLELNRLAASGVIDQRLSSVDFVAGLASRSGIAFRVPRSKFAVPMPYGVTLEQLSTRYLGDPDRWIEIATLNGLRAPYVDEEGFDLPLLVNGRGNQIQIANASNLYVGQQVWLSSPNTSRTIRHITNVTELAPSVVVITLDGEADLERYRTVDHAVMHAFLPDTVNSMMTLYIPSDDAPATDDFQMRDVPGLDVFDELLSVGGFDLLLTSTNDLAITPDGDCRLAVGLTNLVQTARIRLSVVQGSLNRHPSFGLPIKVGQSIADLDAQALLKAVRNLFIDDPAFTSVQSASVNVQGPLAQIALGIGVRGQKQNIALTLDIRAR